MYNNPRTGNPILSQPVSWNDRGMLNTAQVNQLRKGGTNYEKWWSEWYDGEKNN
jgi:hypothetical protein